jgi:hypothetical protein
LAVAWFAAGSIGQEVAVLPTAGSRTANLGPPAWPLLPGLI